MNAPRRVKVAIVDYDIGNLFSVMRACRYAGLEAAVTSDKRAMASSDALILPGVGAFGHAMEHLRMLDLVSFLKDFAAQGKPFLGVCLGMQLLMESSEEFGAHEGLGIIEGAIVRFPPTGAEGERVRVPHIGWTAVTFASKVASKDPIFTGVPDGSHMYFVHSFCVKPAREEDVLATAAYHGVGFCAGIKKGNVYAFQFHPEKSGSVGLALYRNFKHIVEHQEVCT